MAKLTLLDVDESLVAAFRRRAERHGRTLEEEVRRIFFEAAFPERAALLAEAERIRAMTPGTLSDSTELIREDRDSR